MRWFGRTCTCFCFQGESLFLLVGACGVIQIVSRCFTLYFVLPCWDIHVRGSIFFVFLVSNCLLTYIYEFFIDICLYCVLFEIKNLFCLLAFFHTCSYAFCLVFQEIYRMIQLSCCLHVTDGQQLGLSLFYEHLFCKGLFFVNFELLVVFCHGLPKGEFVRF